MISDHYPTTFDNSSMIVRPFSDDIRSLSNDIRSLSVISSHFLVTSSHYSMISGHYPITSGPIESNLVISDDIQQLSNYIRSSFNSTRSSACIALCVPYFCVMRQAEAGEAAAPDTPEYPLSSVLRKRAGTLSIVAEYRRILKSGQCRFVAVLIIMLTVGHLYVSLPSDEYTVQYNVGAS